MSTQQETAGVGTAGTYKINNFDPASIQEEEVILFVLAMDISPSVQPFEKELNEAFKEFAEEMKNSHVAPKLMVKTLEFNEDVKHKTGFTPILSIDPADFNFKATGSSTALFQASYEAVEAAITYREQLENTGINCKVLVFVITDGQGNSGNKSASDVKKLLSDLMTEERNVFSFETILFGIGNPSDFTASQKAMDFKHLAVVGNTGKEMRKMIGFISASVSKSSSNQPITF